MGGCELILTIPFLENRKLERVRSRDRKERETEIEKEERDKDREVAILKFPESSYKLL